ncbi:MAG: polymer-forming cytoskeletal protein [Rhodospirillales bacterium]|nr:polymer-forming cytoskeletal protein [Rhodospirillales bacterium]
MFRRKNPEDEDLKSSPSAESDSDLDEMGAPPLKPFTRKGSHMPNKPPAQPFRPDIPRRVVDIPGAPRRNDRPNEGDGKKLIVGREICLTGEISACDRLVVEGTVEASLSNARSIDITETGLFKGNAEVDDATINGRFEGRLSVRGRLVVRALGKVSGTVRYGSLVVESGGEIAGTVEVVRAANEEQPLLGFSHPPAAADGESKA